MRLDEALDLQAELEAMVAAEYGARLMAEISHATGRLARTGRARTVSGLRTAPMVIADKLALAAPPLAHRLLDRRVVQPPSPPMLGVTRSRTDREGFRIAVRLEDRSRHNVEAANALMSRAGGEADVALVGRLRALVGDELLATRSRARPLRAGLSVAHAGGTAGTSACFVRAPPVADVAILSNNHVIARANRARPGDPVVQPAREDGGSRRQDVVASLSSFVPLRRDGVNLTDCAIAAVTDGVDADPERLASGHEIIAADPREPAELLFTDVFKLGRTTGLTRGTVTAFNVAPRVWFGRERLEFAGQLEIEGADGERFSASGDSGSLVFSLADSDGGAARAVAMLFAGSRQEGVSYATPLPGTLEALGATLLTKAS